MTATGVLVARDLAQAARGVAAVVRNARDDQDAASLTYIAVYACGFAGRGIDLERYRSVLRRWRDEAFVAELRRRVAATVDVTGWVRTGRDDGGRVLVTPDGSSSDGSSSDGLPQGCVRAFVGEDEIVSSSGVGEPVSFTAPLLRSAVMPGFVVRHGRRPVDDGADLSRLYLNTRPATAVWALGTLAERLDTAEVPHRMKVLAHPMAYTRRDSCVVYFASDREAAVVDLVRRVVDEAGRGVLGVPVPRLTARVAPGIGLAHDPTDLDPAGRSHGQWVAGLLHDAARQTTDPRSIARRVRELIADAGRDPSRPHLRGK